MDQQGTGEERRWTPVAADVFSPALAVPAEESVSLFVRGPRGDLLHRRRDGDTWGEPQSFGVPLARVGGSQVTVPVDWPLAACSTGPGEIQLLARGADGELLHGTLRGSEWAGFECVGVPAGLGGAPLGLASAPSACSRGPGRMDVFAIGAAGALLHATWDAAGFGEFESLGGIDLPGAPPAPLSGQLSACNCGERRMGVFARGPAGDLLLKWWNGSAWSAFASLGSPQETDSVYPAARRAAPITSAPAPSGAGATPRDVFARGPRGELLHRHWDGREWSVFESLGMPRSAATGAAIPFTGNSLACAWDPARLEVLARAADGKLYSASWQRRSTAH